MKTVIGLFDTAADAYAAQSDLLGSGIARDRVSVVTSAANKDPGTVEESGRTEAKEGAGIGAVAGGIAGGAAGILATMGLLAIPGIGPILAAGPIVALLTGTAIGAAAGGVVGGLIGLGIPADEAELYAEGIHRGGTLVTVDAADADADRIAAVLSQHNAVDIDKRASEWEATGWQRKHQRSVTGSAASAVDPRTRGVDRESTTGGMDPGASDIASVHRANARIYNP
jgi:hypothetical protein